MAAAESNDEARKSFIIRLSLHKRKAVAPPPPPLSHHHHHHVEKRMKFHDSNYSTTTALVKNKIHECVQQQQQLVDEKRRKVTAPVGKDSRMSRNPSPPPPLVKERSYKIVDSRKRKNDGTMECNKEEKKMMDQGKKNQCWVIVKRMIVGKDGRVLKKSLNLKGLAYFDQIKEEFKTTTMKTMGLEDIEVNLNKWLYSVPEEFADDMRLVLSPAFLYPPRSQVHRIARKLSEKEKNRVTK